MEKKTKREGASSGAQRLEKIFFGFYALLAEHFSLCIRHVRGQGARCSTRTFATVLTALTIHLFQAKTSFVAFQRVSQRAFLPSHFLCSLALFSTIQKVFSSCFTHCFISIGQQGAARATFTTQSYHTPKCATYVCMCLTSLPGVAPSRALLTSVLRS